MGGLRFGRQKLRKERESSDVPSAQIKKHNTMSRQLRSAASIVRGLLGIRHDQEQQAVETNPTLPLQTTGSLRTVSNRLLQWPSASDSDSTVVSAGSSYDEQDALRPFSSPETSTQDLSGNGFSEAFKAVSVTNTVQEPLASDDAIPLDTYDNYGGPDLDEPFDRRNFNAIRAIPREVMENFVLDLIKPKEEQRVNTCHVTRRVEGSFHHAVFLSFELNEQLQQEYVLKIPVHGTPSNWQDGDTFMLRNEAVLMQHIRNYTDCPVPDVIAFDATLHNAIGAPFILMKKTPGIQASDMWFDRRYKELPPGGQHLNADEPSPETEQKRIVFLKSLAQAMSSLQSLTFDQIGIPVFDNAHDPMPLSYGPVWRWHSKTSMHPLTPLGPFHTVKKFIQAGLDKEWSPDLVTDHDPASTRNLHTNGVRKVLDMAFSSSPFTSSPTDNQANTNAPFVLRHDDLDLQNILVDASGRVTGIIDWDGCMSVPACVGYTSHPTFLRRDWLPEYATDRFPHMSWSLRKYRSIYAAAMQDACGAGKARYTAKSDVYQALLAAVHEEARVREVLDLVVQGIEGFGHVDKSALYVQLGWGWPAAEKVLMEKIGEVLEP